MLCILLFDGYPCLYCLRAVSGGQNTQCRYPLFRCHEGNCILFDAFDESVDDRCQWFCIEAVLRGIIQVGLFPVLPVKCHRMPVRISYGRGLFAVDDGLPFVRIIKPVGQQGSLDARAMLELQHCIILIRNRASVRQLLALQAGQQFCGNLLPHQHPQ